MRTSPYTTGDIATVYSSTPIGTTDETCNLGCTHTVSYYSRKFLTVDRVVAEVIPFLEYNRAGIGEIEYAHDYQGRQYIRKPHWDGPGIWVREDRIPFTHREPYQSAVSMNIVRIVGE